MSYSSYFIVDAGSQCKCWSICWEEHSRCMFKIIQAGVFWMCWSFAMLETEQPKGVSWHSEAGTESLPWRPVQILTKWQSLSEVAGGLFNPFNMSHEFFSIPSSKACGLYLEIAVQQWEPISTQGVCGSRSSSATLSRRSPVRFTASCTASRSPHHQYGISSLSKFAIVCHLPLVSGTLRHTIFPKPFLRHILPSPISPVPHIQPSGWQCPHINVLSRLVWQYKLL